MTWFEIALIVKESFGWIFSVPLIVGVLYIFPGFMMGLDGSEESIKKYFKYYKIVIPVILISSLFVSLPNVETLWKVRIGLIKYTLASSDNLEKGVEAIERIGKKLECKYLGCEKDNASED